MVTYVIIQTLIQYFHLKYSSLLTLTHFLLILRIYKFLTFTS